MKEYRINLKKLIIERRLSITKVSKILEFQELH